MTQHVHQLGKFQLGLDPEQGGVVAELSFDGVPVLRRAQSPLISALDSSAYPLFPFSGRIDHGRFVFDGGIVELVPNFQPEPHAIHGKCWQAPWTHEVLPDSVVLQREHGGEDWPWPYRSKQTFSAEANTFKLMLELENRSDRIMPAGFGWHPFFDANGASLSAGAERIWDAEPGEISSSSRPTNYDNEISRQRSVAELNLDNAFPWDHRSAVLCWPNRTVRMTADPVFNTLIVYTPPQEDFFCVEPVSHIPDAVNSELDASVTGLRRLAPGDKMCGSITLQVDLR